MSTTENEAPWAYQNAADLSDNLSEETVDLSNAIAEEETPEDLLDRVEKIDKVLDELREELDEMPRF